MHIVLFWRRIGSDYQTSRPPSIDAYSQQINLVNDGGPREEVHLEAAKVQGSIDQDCLDFRKMMLEK
jgi:hypothetical protein